MPIVFQKERETKLMQFLARLFGACNQAQTSHRLKGPLMFGTTTTSCCFKVSPKIQYRFFACVHMTLLTLALKVFQQKESTKYVPSSKAIAKVAFQEAGTPFFLHHHQMFSQFFVLHLLKV